MEERIVFEKMVNVKVIKGKADGIERFCKKDILKEKLEDIVERAYSGNARRLTLELNVDCESVPTIEYTLEEMVLPKENYERSEK